MSAPFGHVAKFRCLTLHELPRGLDHRAVLQDVERRSIGLLRLAIPPMPDRAQDRTRSGGQRSAAGDPPGLIRIALSRNQGLLERALTRLAKPFHPPKRLHLLLHFRRQGEKKVRVVFRVFLHRRRERTARPVRFLRAFGERDVKILLDQRREAELLQSEHPRRDDRVEDLTDGKIIGATKQAQIEIHALEHNFPLGQRAAERLQIDRGQRIDQMILAVEGQLDEAKLFEIAVQTVGLGIDRDAVEPLHPRKEIRELCIGRDHLRPASKSSALLLVACRFLINISIASSGGSAAIVLRNNCTRSHSSGW